MCISGSCVKAEAESLVLDVLCGECRARVHKKLENLDRSLFDFYPEDYPICPKCMKTARKVLGDFSRSQFG